MPNRAIIAKSTIESDLVLTVRVERPASLAPRRGCPKCKLNANAAPSAGRGLGIVNLLSQLRQWLKKQRPRHFSGRLRISKCRIVWTKVIIANALISLPGSLNTSSAFGDPRREIEYRCLDAALRLGNNMRQISAGENVQTHLVIGGKRRELRFSFGGYRLRAQTEPIGK